MYQRLNEFAFYNNLTFSAYYDDFIFSSDNFVVAKRCREVIKIIERYNLKVNSDKTRLVIGNHVKITGGVMYVVNKKKNKV